MKRPLLTAFIVGLIVVVVIAALQWAGVLAPLEQAITRVLSRQGSATMTVSNGWQYVFVLIFSVSVAWMTLRTSQRSRLAVILAILAIELMAVAWLCSLYQIIFQPLPSILGVVLGFLAPIGFLEITAAADRRRDQAPALAPEALEVEPRARIKRAELTSDSLAKACEVTAVVCDIANKHDLAEECEPAVLAEVTQDFLARTTEAFRKAGAYIESAGGEGVVAIFGYPESDKQHAEKAARLAMLLTQTASDSNKPARPDLPATAGVHAGVSSGIMIMAPFKNNGQRGLLATGEPVELARRFSIANRFYGSRVLLGPRTFELASKILVARPIDFLSGVDVRERHEIYEPIALALEASREQITRRDAFWNGVVLYREKRWAEAYSQFQNARGPDGEEDRPLQLYLRRLEPLALQLTETPIEY
jgi:class 3 adenylate cyclase